MAPKYMYVRIENESQNWQVKYDEDLINSLVEDDSWIELERQQDDKIKHRLYNPVQAPIKFIEWEE